jgi:uracil-DNA glycosylase
LAAEVAGLFDETAPASLPVNALRGTMAEQWDSVPQDWRTVTESFRHTEAGRALSAFIDARRAADAVVYPSTVFEALRLTPLSEVRVVILGQDPYHGPGQAHGLAFSVREGQRVPPSLRNLFKELQRDLGQPVPPSGDLSAWARRGVLLLNTTLTVEDGRPASHAGHGWDVLTRALLGAVAALPHRVVFLLWGAHAQAQAAWIDTGRHSVLRANHPSPLSATRAPVPFIGCGHFGQAHALLSPTGFRGWAVDGKEKMPVRLAMAGDSPA